MQSENMHLENNSEKAHGRKQEDWHTGFKKYCILFLIS